MKVVEIVPRERTRLYRMLVDKEAAIRKNKRGTYIRVGPKTRDRARWRHKNFRGSVQLAKRDDSEVVTVSIRAPTAEDERKLLSSFLGFVDRHSGDQVATITIQYR